MSAVMSSVDFSYLQPLQRLIGHQFANPQLLQQALTHRSWSKTSQQQLQNHHNEVLEFLGDAVLSLVVANYLYRCYPHAKEGMLSRLRSSFVCQTNLFEAAKKLELHRWIRASQAVCASGALHQPSTLSDTLEAIVAAVYLDSGLSAAQQVIHRVLDMQQNAVSSLFYKDPKTQLQEKLQKRLGKPPEYRVVDFQGPQHAPYFTVEVLVENKALAQGQGSNKQKAQQQAASRALEKLKASR
ncbi:MAG: ribonuclease III [Myxococcota bacterium]